MLQRRPDLFHQTDSTLCANQGIFLCDFLDFGDSFAKTLARQP
jgi:hypothetical protein